MKFSLMAVLFLKSISSTLAQERAEELPPDAERTFFSTVTAEANYSFPSRISLGGGRSDDMDTFQHRLTYYANFPQNEAFQWRGGLDWQRFWFDVSSGAPLPDYLQSISVPLGMTWKFHEKWQLSGQIWPGIFSDFEDISEDDLRAPLTAALSYLQRPGLTWLAGFNFDHTRDFPIFGFVGVRWRFAERWNLSVIFPRPRLEYRATDNLRFYASMALAGGSYQVGEDFGTKHGAPRLDNERVSYREIRVGPGIRYRMGRVSAELEGGWVVDRRFKYPDEDVLFNGDGTGYVRVSLSGSF